MIRRDPIENEIELALSPGEFIRGRACFSLVSCLEAVAGRIDILLKSGSARAKDRRGVEREGGRK
jgi:hypothetical protein